MLCSFQEEIARFYTLNHQWMKIRQGQVVVPFRGMSMIGVVGGKVVIFWTCFWKNALWPEFKCINCPREI